MLRLSCIPLSHEETTKEKRPRLCNAGGAIRIRGGLFFIFIFLSSKVTLSGQCGLLRYSKRWKNGSKKKKKKKRVARDDEWMTGQWDRSDARECFMTIQYRERRCPCHCCTDLNAIEFVSRISSYGKGKEERYSEGSCGKHDGNEETRENWRKRREKGVDYAEG